MNKQSQEKFTFPFFPIFNDVYSKPFINSILAGVLGGAGVSAAANLLRQYRELRKERKDETNDDTIVLNLPAKAAAAGYDGMKAAKPGETKVTANGARQFREDGKYGKGTHVGPTAEQKASVKCATGPLMPWTKSDVPQDPNSVATMVFSTLGLTAGGLASYEVVSRLFDRLNERRLKRKLQAAQQAYVNALSGAASKRAEAVLRILDPVEHVLCKDNEKTAESRISSWFNGLTDALPQTPVNALRIPMAAYILGLLASTGATAYVTKKVMDREFPEEKLKKDLNRPTRIVFRMAGTQPALLEGVAGQEKTASDLTCAAVTALLPIYKDVVEGLPSRTLDAPYVKLAEDLGTDPAGLLKMAQVDFMKIFMRLLQNPSTLWSLLVNSRFGLDLSKRRAAQILQVSHPDVFRDIVGMGIEDQFSGPGLKNWAARHTAHFINNSGHGDFLAKHKMNGSSAGTVLADAAKTGLRKTWNRMTGSGQTQPSTVKSGAAGAVPVDWETAKLGLRGALYGASGGYALTDFNAKQKKKLRNMAIGAGAGTVALPAIVKLVQHLTTKKQSVKPELRLLKTSGDETFLHSNYLGAAVFGDRTDDDDKSTSVDEKDVITKARRSFKGRRGIRIEAADPKAAKYIAANKALIKRLLARMNAQGAI